MNMLASEVSAGDTADCRRQQHSCSGHLQPAGCNEAHAHLYIELQSKGLPGLNSTMNEYILYNCATTTAHGVQGWWYTLSQHTCLLGIGKPQQRTQLLHPLQPGALTTSTSTSTQQRTIKSSSAHHELYHCMTHISHFSCTATQLPSIQTGTGGHPP